MVHPKERPLRAFIAGYQDISAKDFAAHYHQEIKEAIKDGDLFILSDEPGACEMALQYLRSKRVSGRDITIYRSTSNTTNEGRLEDQFKDATVRTISGGEAERLAAMSENSDYEIVWLRPGNILENPRLSAGGVLDLRCSGPEEAARLGMAKSVLACMAFYDEIA